MVWSLKFDLASGSTGISDFLSTRILKVQGFLWHELPTNRGMCQDQLGLFIINTIIFLIFHLIFCILFYFKLWLGWWGNVHEKLWSRLMTKSLISRWDFNLGFGNATSVSQIPILSLIISIILIPLFNPYTSDIYKNFTIYLYLVSKFKFKLVLIM